MVPAYAALNRLRGILGAQPEDQFFSGYSLLKARDSSAKMRCISLTSL